MSKTKDGPWMLPPSDSARCQIGSLSRCGDITGARDNRRASSRGKDVHFVFERPHA